MAASIKQISSTLPADTLRKRKASLTEDDSGLAKRQRPSPKAIEFEREVEDLECSAEYLAGLTKPDPKRLAQKSALEQIKANRAASIARRAELAAKTAEHSSTGSSAPPVKSPKEHKAGANGDRGPKKVFVRLPVKSIGEQCKALLARRAKGENKPKFD